MSRGLQVFEANKPLIQKLRTDGRLLRVASYEHSYPHCWRCRNPLIYKAVSSWFVRVPEFRDPHDRAQRADQLGSGERQARSVRKWIGNAREWSVSRNRYWGSPIPVWKSDNPAFPRVDVYGSLAELEADFGRLPRNAAGEPDLHRPFIDELTRPNPDDRSGASTMRRIEDVFDVWFDSGSMPFAQVHYPFENQDWFDTHNPADFIVEYIGQTRGWFYLMHVLSTALFDRPAFSNVISHGIVLGSDGQKMSKSLRNYPDVSQVFDRDGADAMRWFLMSSSVIRGGNLIVSEEGIREGVRQFLLPLWSTYYFFTLYSNASDYDARWRTDSRNVLDQYLLAKTGALITEVTTHLEALDAPLAATTLRDFAEVLTNWYVRRSRDRFWAGDDPDAFDTLFTVLETVARVAAPLIPLVAEEIWQGLTGGRSVHLEDWPLAELFPSNPTLVAAMDLVREVASAGLALRKAQGLRVRLPLAKLTVVTPGSTQLNEYRSILEEELNVKEVAFEKLLPTSLEEHGVEQVLTVNARALGPRLGKGVQAVIQAAKAGNWEALPFVRAGGEQLFEGEYDLVLRAADEASAISFLGNGGFVVLDTVTTPELEAEGLARDVIRSIQDTRKAADLRVSDRITLTIRGSHDGDIRALRSYSETIAGEVLARSIAIEFAPDPATDAALHATAGSARSAIAAGQFSNEGVLVIDVWKSEQVDV